MDKAQRAEKRENEQERQTEAFLNLSKQGVTGIEKNAGGHGVTTVL